TTLDSYRTAAPQWDVLLDLDQLARDESEDWIWRDATFLPATQARSLIQLSRGGGDATVIREFEVTAKRFVSGGFVLPEAKHETPVWVDADTLLVASPLGPDGATRSGLARTVRRWRRGESFERAAVVFEGDASDVRVSGDHFAGFDKPA